MASNTIELFSDKDIERLKKIKEIIEEIKGIDSNFSLSNIISIDKESILVFTTTLTINKESQNKIEKQLTEQFGIECKLISGIISLDKAINIKKDNKQEKDYTTICEYQAGVLAKEETIQYK